MRSNKIKGPKQDSQNQSLRSPNDYYLLRQAFFSPGIPVSSTNKTDHHDIAEILLKVALNTFKQTNKQTNKNNVQV